MQVLSIFFPLFSQGCIYPSQGMKMPDKGYMFAVCIYRFLYHIFKYKNLMSTIKINDKLQEIELPLSIAEIIKLNNVVQPGMVSVQLNGEFVLRDDFESTLLKEADEIDFLYFMGGGSDNF